MGHSVLVVPVPALERFVRARWAHYDPEWVSADPSFTHAHVTLLAPWLEEPTSADLATVAAVAAQAMPFDYLLADVAAFPNGIVHTPPVPTAPFTTLTARLAAAFPQCPPYGGEFGDPEELEPHVTLDHLDALEARSAQTDRADRADRADVTDSVGVAAVRAALGGVLPAHGRAEHLEWQWYDAGDCHVRSRWPLGTAPVAHGSPGVAPATVPWESGPSRG